MGGASGHIRHLHEVGELTFGELKSIMRKADRGRLVDVTEKVDGQALTFTWSIDRGLRVARSLGDIVSGGMTQGELQFRFGDKWNVAETFIDGFKVLRAALAALDPVDQRAIFANGRFWFGVEIVNKQNPNVIVYDRNALIVHGFPIFVLGDSGRPEAVPGGVQSKRLQEVMGALQRAVVATGWVVSGPLPVSMCPASTTRGLQKIIERIDRAQRSTHTKDTETLDDHLQRLFEAELVVLDLDDDLTSDIARRCAERPGCQTLTQLKRRAGSAAMAVGAFVDGSEKMGKSLMRPVELAIHAMAVSVLSRVGSHLILDRGAAVADIRRRVVDAHDEIVASGDRAAIDIMMQNVTKLGDLRNIDTCVEGIVFRHKKTFVKLTGAFAPVNQILGIRRYDRTRSICK